MEIQQLIIGGKQCSIAPLKDINDLEVKSANMNPLTEHQYLSLLYNNLGYEKCPDSLAFTYSGVGVEYANRNTVNDYPITKNKLMINRNGMPLYDLLDCINIWGRGEIERGEIIDESKSFFLPSELEIKYHINNNIKIKRSLHTIQQTVFWRSTDIYKKRLHNLVPKINPDYADLCIRKFREYSRQIIVYRPCVLFLLSIVNPDSIMSMIRETEMACAIKANKKYGEYSALRKDYDTVILFAEEFQKVVDKYADIYEQYGPKAIVDQVVPFIPTDRVVARMDVKEEDSQENIFDNMSPEDRYTYIYQGINLTKENKEFMYKYFNKSSLPESLTKIIKMTDANGEEQDTYDSRYIPTLKRIYFTLNRIQDKFPELLDTKDKFIFSDAFFLDSTRFALYNSSSNKYVLCLADMSNEIVEPQEAVDRYKELYDITVKLDPVELGNNLESKEADKYTIIDNSNKPVATMNTIINPLYPITTQVITTNENIQPINEEMYSVDMDKLVEN